jgi:hypothetical protein
VPDRRGVFGDLQEAVMKIMSIDEWEKKHRGEKWGVPVLVHILPDLKSLKEFISKRIGPISFQKRKKQ